jgi:hypothetical protein
MASCLGEMQIQALIRDESKDEQQNEDAEGSEHSKEGHGNGEHGHCSAIALEAGSRKFLVGLVATALRF